VIRRREEPQGERSPEERVRAAAERAARRADPPLAPRTDAGRAQPRAEAPRVEAPRAEAPPAEAPRAEAPRAEAPRAEAPRAEPRRAEEPRAEPPPPPEPAPEPGDFESDFEPEPDLEPLPRRTVAHPGRRRPPKRRTPRRPTRSSYTKATGGFAGRRILAVVGLALIGLALYAINATFQPFHGDPEGSVAVTIPPNTDVGEIGRLLAEQGVVDSGTFFRINATVTGRRGGLKPGDYELTRNMSNGAAIEALTQGPEVKVVPTFSITIPEGRARSEVVPLVEDNGKVRGDYERATESRAAVRRARELGLPRGSRNLEGFLFPATYELVDPSPARDLVAKQLDAFESYFSEINLRRARRANLTPYDVVIIASMVEREAQLDRERPLVAAVIWNRLQDGMTLGIDATIRYAEDNWTEPLRQSELDRDTPYNTRINRGLPPTPIGNPGQASLEAAANPAREDYLFYVVKPGTCGEHAFSSTDAQFQRDLARYNQAREEAGGQSPTTC
jgi:UPF0755 protein